MIDVLVAVLLVAGSLLALTAAIGVVRFPDLLTRMHAATKPQTLGLLLVVVAVALRLDDRTGIGMLVVVAVFQLMTAPVSAHMVGRAAVRAGMVRRDLLAVDETHGDEDA